ncbi:unnamed protein product [Phytophthora fragariaefolia]|uniref:Unnamed protein product n=1 Tax=Phytophthora fragariaefolia TaxID=1490495 RepID=A0A9W6Y2Q9_9STRA|nr:unnamed protein product [Phytophthora fragariaefolia]
MFRSFQVNVQAREDGQDAGEHEGHDPVTTEGRSSARPRSADAATNATASTPRSVKFDRDGDQDHGSDNDGSEDGLEMKGPRSILDDDEVDELTMVVGKSRPIAPRLGSEFDEVTSARALAPDERPTTGTRPPLSEDTPNAPIDSSGFTQLAEQTKRLLDVMGFECAAIPSKVALQIWELGDASAELTRWKRKLKDSFGVRSSTTVQKPDRIDPSTVPLPSMPKKGPAGAGFQTLATKGDVFSKSVESPYFMDSHMITPKKSRGRRRINEDTDDEDDGDDYAGRDYANRSAKTEKHGEHGNCSWILWKLPAWGIVIAASAHLPSTTVNIAEYTGMNNGVRPAIEHGVSDLIIVGDSRLAIQQSVAFAESTRHRPTSQEAVNEVDDLPADQKSPISPQGCAQRSAREGTGNLETTLDEPVRADPKEASEREDPTTVQTERIRRVRVAQDEERRWADLKAYLRGDVESLSFKRAANVSKLTDRFVLDEDGLHRYVGKRRKLDEVGEHEPQLRLVIPTTMIDEVLQSCHDSIEGGHQGITRTFHRVKKDYYWVGLYATVTRHVRACADGSTSKGKPHLKGYSPGNVLAERPFQLLSMDFVTPLPKTRRGNTSLLLFQCTFTGYVIAKAMSSTQGQDSPKYSRNTCSDVLERR